MKPIRFSTKQVDVIEAFGITFSGDQCAYILMGTAAITIAALSMAGCIDILGVQANELPPGYVPNAKNFTVSCSESHDSELFEVREIGRVGMLAVFTRHLTTDTAQSSCAKMIVASCEHGYKLTYEQEDTNGIGVVYTGYCYSDKAGR